MHSSDTLFAAHNKVRATGLLAAGISECAYWKVSTSQLSLLFSYLYIFDEYVFFTLHLSKWTLRLRWLVTGSTQTSESEMWRRFFAPAAVKFTTTNVNHERVQICRRYTHSRREDVRVAYTMQLKFPACECLPAPASFSRSVLHYSDDIIIVASQVRESLTLPIH